MVRKLSVKEATQFTGKSESTIKRLIREITADPNHADRHFISPSHEEVEKRRDAGEPYTWKISEDLLAARYGDEGKGESDETTKQTSGEGSSADGDRLINVLEKTITVLESELGQKNQQIAALQERQREQNLLMKNLQDQLLLAAPSSSSPTAPKDVAPEKRQSSKEGTQKNEKPTKTTKTKQSFWHREFHLFGPKSRK